ncbi:hypothetical protein [Chryseobacterium populi]|uniref:Uncharacterized protein n=1 Tax=Chryseobacterium populi TaxID=1144316 RepID=J2JLD9_9FLAO|nr:hypothetical protein [Chryseobacterium populi]EJL68700.1 hypothetical protein PMI13_03526 [Chryseobacterium populi]
MKIYRFISALQTKNYINRTLHKWFYNNGQRQFPPMRLFRFLWSFYPWPVNNRPHFYKIIKEVGDVSEKTTVPKFYKFLTSQINFLVPYSVLGGNNELFGPRINGGIATAGGGGPVFTENDDENFTLRNTAMEGHIFEGGEVSSRVYKENNKVYLEVIGSGENNFAWVNEVVGKQLFIGLADLAVNTFNKE